VACKEKLETYLREERVPIEVRHHRRAVTAQEVAASEHVPGKMLAKTVMILADKERSTSRRRDLGTFSTRSPFRSGEPYA
jgi:prolyl-tRNA editing enzyme YbaK/EbsC (Cys-tRNA(Pro) deacylase)